MKRPLLKPGDDSIIAVRQFIQAIRDSGYKGTTSAVAELVDNALEARAHRIAIWVEPDLSDPQRSMRVVVADNGIGMDVGALRQSLRFGGSSRFNNRSGLGRYGLGLPNSSFSQARRVEVITWRRGHGLTTYLDLDEIVQGRLTAVPDPRRTSVPKMAALPEGRSGTIVTWRRCDRLDHRRADTVAAKLSYLLGRVFRFFLWDGIEIVVNGKSVQAIDPLLVHERSYLRGASQFGKPLEYKIRVPLPDGHGFATGGVIVKFSELPVGEWHNLANEEKQQLGITRGAGVSVVRARREIDYGWFFLGQKRKENYDDWWRCEVQFDPGLDEVFGITHTKQQIKPSEDLARAIVPDIEAVARALNRRVRQAHEKLKLTVAVVDSEAIASSRDRLLPPLAEAKVTRFIQQELTRLRRLHPRIAMAAAANARGVHYTLIVGSTKGTRLFNTYCRSGQVLLTLNTQHQFYHRLYRPLCERKDEASRETRKQLELLLFAAARTESALGRRGRQFLETWSNTVGTFF